MTCGIVPQSVYRSRKRAGELADELPHRAGRRPRLAAPHEPAADDHTVGDLRDGARLVRGRDPEAHRNGRVGRSANALDRLDEPRRQLAALARHAGERDGVDESARTGADLRDPLRRARRRDERHQREALGVAGSADAAGLVVRQVGHDHPGGARRRRAGRSARRRRSGSRWCRRAGRPAAGPRSARRRRAPRAAWPRRPARRWRRRG